MTCVNVYIYIHGHYTLAYHFALSRKESGAHVVVPLVGKAQHNRNIVPEVDN